MNAGTGNWGRQGYYNADAATAQGLTFLNTKGGDACSGTWDTTLGNSLSYAAANGKDCSPTPQVLTGSIDDGDEIAIFTADECTRGACGYFRPKTVAHHGFAGASKMFLIEFEMPTTGAKGFNMDMPAAWILNADIPPNRPIRSLQLLGQRLWRIRHLRSPRFWKSEMQVDMAWSQKHRRQQLVPTAEWWEDSEGGGYYGWWFIDGDDRVLG